MNVGSFDFTELFPSMLWKKDLYLLSYKVMHFYTANIYSQLHCLN